MAETISFKFRAFLSYSHRDIAWAQWLHHKLESYRVDKDLVGRQTTAGPVPKTLRPIFRDREDFSAGHSLSGQTISALEASQFLIVICSPTSAKSQYVNEEIRRFKMLGRSDHVIPIIIDGDPGSDVTDCFPPALRLRFDSHGVQNDDFEEPIAADARQHGDGKVIAKQKVIATLLGLQLDEIVRREERARKRRNRVWMAIASVLLLLAVAAGGSAAYAWQQLKNNEAFLNATLKRATGIINTAVTQAQKYHVPRAATVNLLQQAEGLLDDMATFARPTPELRLRKTELLLEFARSYAVLGKTNFERDRAEAAYDLIQQLAKDQPDNEEVQLTLSYAFIQLGDVYRVQGYLDPALAQYEVSLMIGKRFSVIHGTIESARWWTVVSMCNERIGDVLRVQGKLGEAIKYYQSDLAQSNGNPVAHERMGEVYFDLGRKDDALREYRVMLQINFRLASSEPDNVEWKRNLSVSHHQVGRVLLSQGKTEEALTEFRADLTIIKELADTDQSNKGWERDVAVAYGMVGDTLIAQGNVAEAIKNYKARLSVQAALSAGDPENEFWQVDLSNSYASIADAFVTDGNLEDAFLNYRKSHAVLEHVCASDPSNVQRSLDLLWSHSRLALFGDNPVKRFEFIVATLRELESKNKLTPEQQKWLPVAHEALIAVSENKYWQWYLLQMYWRTASFTSNPVRQATLVVAMARKLRDENKLTSEQAGWIPNAESQLDSMRNQIAHQDKADSVRSQIVDSVFSQMQAHQDKADSVWSHVGNPLHP